MGAKSIQRLVGAAALLSALVVVSAAPAKAPPPKVLYAALLKSPIPGSQLPTGFGSYSATTKATESSSRAKRHHIVGNAQIDIGGVAAILYSVYATHADVLAAWKEADPAHYKGATSVLAAPGYPKPALVINAPITRNNPSGKKVTAGSTSVVFLVGNVGVTAITISPDSTKRGDVPAAHALAKLALSHLRAVEAQVGGAG